MRCSTGKVNLPSGASNCSSRYPRMLFSSTWQDGGKATLLRADARGDLASFRRAILLVVAVPVPGPRPRHVGDGRAGGNRGGRDHCHAFLLRWRSRFGKEPFRALNGCRACSEFLARRPLKSFPAPTGRPIPSGCLCCSSAHSFRASLRVPKPCHRTTGSIASAPTGSAHHHPKAAYSPTPASSASER